MDVLHYVAADPQLRKELRYLKYNARLPTPEIVKMTGLTEAEIEGL